MPKEMEIYNHIPKEIYEYIDYLANNGKYKYVHSEFVQKENNKDKKLNIMVLLCTYVSWNIQRIPDDNIREWLAKLDVDI